MNAKTICIIAALTAGTTLNVARASTIQSYGLNNETLEHGGGCRKSSPPGQCCHMDNSTGVVHCH